MKFPCEEIANKIIPAIRAEIAVRLAKDYGMKQVEISKILGITQGAVSHYITSFRGKEREVIEKNPDIKKKIDEITKLLVNGRDIEGKICEICRELRFSSNFKHFF